MYGYVTGWSRTFRLIAVSSFSATGEHCDVSKRPGALTQRRSVAPNTPPGALLSAHPVPQHLSHSTHKTRRNEASPHSGTRSVALSMKTTPVTNGNYRHFASRSVHLLSVQKKIGTTSGVTFCTSTVCAENIQHV